MLFINLDPVQSSDSGGTIGDIEQQLLQTAFEAVYPSLAKFDGKHPEKPMNGNLYY